MYNNIDSLKIEADESDYLYTDTSQIEGAGLGLFTAIKIFKSEVIAVFKGELIPIEEQKKRVAANQDEYFISLISGRVMDSMHIECFAKYANDAEGFIKSKFKNNAVITLDEDDHVCLIATRTIKIGEEIFCAYGEEYWKNRNL